ncbi:MAG: NTTRR-F1 domain [Firmicutes bacterium]|nr:NTTRR-F1 domain [Bacillota bacterium]
MAHPKGNLIVNGGFETGTVGSPPPSPWISSNVEIVDSTQAHTGTQIASLGETTPADPAFLFQDVTIAPGRFYELTFHVTGTVLAASAGPIRAEVRWLNADGRDLGSGLSAFVSGGNTGTAVNGEWLAVFELTGKSPPDAARARILFSRSDTLPPMLLDDVLFADQS